VNPLNYLYDAVAWLITQIHSGWSLFLSPGSGLTWVLTIVVLVVLMRLILVPLFIKQMHATRKMSALAPQLQELKKKYKNDRQTLNEETMRLYRENGVNPLGGCLPLLGQMPVFFGLFQVLRGIAEWKPGSPVPYGMTAKVVASAQNADIFGAHISDKFLFSSTTPLHAKIVILFAVLISVTTTFMTVRQSTKRGMTPQMTPDNPMAASQKYMAYIVPLFALSGLYWQFGLVLYWVTTNVWTLGQQYVLFKRYPMTPALAGGETASDSKPATASGSRRPPPTGQAQRKGTKPGPAGGQSARQGSAARPGNAARQGGTGRPGAAQRGGKPASGQPAKRAGQAASGQSSDGRSAANGSGILRRFGRGRQEAEPEQPETPEVKLVRQQRTRQSRSKRSGKR
jgi:YidC/Oxa1 family membrane protein insertase